jgi:hypothetical protein
MLSSLKRIIREEVKRIINEMHYEDLYPPEFVEFRKKYLALGKNYKGNDLYIQFTDYAPTKRHKKAHETPDHSDFIGIYGYPLSYVVNYPADIWYGRNAARLRVLQDTSQKILSLNYMTWRDAQSAVYKLGFDMGLLDIARKNYKHSGATMAGKCFLSVLQFKMEELPISDNSDRMVDKKKINYAQRSGREQTDLLLKLGYDCVKDSSSNHKQAVINNREPEQICFLTRSSFKVLDIINFTQPEADRKYKSLAGGGSSHRDFEKLFAERIFNAIDDSAKNVPREENSHIYFSQKGRQLQIDFNEFDKYNAGYKMGEKRHRDDKLYTRDVIVITLESERGVITYRSQPKQKIKEAVQIIQSEFNESQEIPGWQPLSFVNHKEKQSQIAAETYRQNQLKKLPEFVKDIEDLAEALHLPWNPPGPIEENLQTYSRLELLCNFCHRRMRDDEDFNVAWARITETLKLDKSVNYIQQIKEILHQYYVQFKNNNEITNKSTFSSGSYWAARAIKERDADPQV